MSRKDPSRTAGPPPIDSRSPADVYTQLLTAEKVYQLTAQATKP